VYCDIRHGKIFTTEKREMIEYLKLKAGFRTALADGTLVPDSPKHMATDGFYHAVPGSRLHLCDQAYLFAPAIFSLRRDPKYIYEYAYQQEENWSTYTQNLTPETYQKEDYFFEEECYFRVCIRREDGADLSTADQSRAPQLMEYHHTQPKEIEQPFFRQEIEDTSKTILGCAGRDALKLCLLADTHYTVNGTWEDTAQNIQRVSEKAAYDAIIHLGDLTDGMVSKELTREYAGRVIGDLEQCGVPVYITPGNHDSNYFRNPGNSFDEGEMKEIYHLPGETSDYYIDIPDKPYPVRLIFLASFEDTAAIRYGYTEDQLLWLQRTLDCAPVGTRFLIFSHDAPLAKLDYWSWLIRNGEELLKLLEDCNRKEEYQVVGLFYGHTHADAAFLECSFPIVSVGCAKLEYFLDKKPEGSVVWSRQAGTVTQDLWDSLIVDFQGQSLKLVRFGAGEDREFSFVKGNGSYREKVLARRCGRKMKIWAHRGASGHAPENTIPAFELADQLGADGIELDVQLTKDGIPVVIHDETVDRVSDRKGWVKDYTLEQLKELNVNQRFPAWGRVQVPTLAEVYDFVARTDLTVNLELKNGLVFQEGLEEKVLRLAEEKGISDRIIYSSFNHYSMRKIRELSPEARIAFLYSNGILDIWEYAAKYGAYAVHPSLTNIAYPHVVQRCHEKGIRVHVWTVNEAVDFERMKRAGVDAVITNYVERGE